MLKYFPSLSYFVGLILKLALFYSVLFFIVRLLFCYFNIPENNNEQFSDYLSAYIMGLRFDLIIISYVLMLPALILFLHQTFFKANKFLITAIKMYLGLITALILFIACANIPYFAQFGSHITTSVFAWRLTPGYTLKLIFSSIGYWGFFIVFLLLFVSYIKLSNIFFRIYLKNLDKMPTNSLLASIGRFLVLAFLIFAAARGRLSSKSPMHEGMAIVSQNVFVNQIALNPNFTLIKSISRKASKTDFLQNITTDLALCQKFYPQNQFPQNGKLSSVIASTTLFDSINKLNVVVVLMESFNMAKMGYYHNKNLSPYLTELAKESVFFDRFFSSGIHTFNGLFSSTTGFPSIYSEQGLRQYTKQPFITLANLLKPYGYESYFCATHDPVFDNMEGFFKLNGFNNIISSNDFSSDKSLGVTGIPDHLLYNKLVQKINEAPQGKPFVAYIMTGADHGPWAIPKDVDFKPSGADEKENASMYADWSVKQFIEEAKKSAWYKNTVFVFLGDHGQIMNDVYDMPINYHHIPFIVHCPKELKPEVNHNLGYQPDIVRTVSSLLKINYSNFSFGVNIFKEKRPFVFFSADDKIGYVTEDDHFFYHLLSTNQKNYVKYTTMDKTNYYQVNKAHADSLYKETKSLYNSAQYFINNNYFNF
jgi:phosphoglycerol transferase MdoB-like AlkP superfamily enzyme